MTDINYLAFTQGTSFNSYFENKKKKVKQNMFLNIVNNFLTMVKSCEFESCSMQGAHDM